MQWQQFRKTVRIGTGGNGFIHLKVFQHICDKSEAQTRKDDNIAKPVATRSEQHLMQWQQFRKQCLLAPAATDLYI
jgi:hypothetical protein